MSNYSDLVQSVSHHPMHITAYNGGVTGTFSSNSIYEAHLKGTNFHHNVESIQGIRMHYADLLTRRSEDYNKIVEGQKHMTNILSSDGNNRMVNLHYKAGKWFPR